MIAGLKPYPAMKDSGVPWLGMVPEHWNVLPNRAIFVEVNEREHPEEQMLSVTINRGVIRQQALLADSSKKDSSNQEKSAYKLVRPGDIAYNKMRAWQGAVGMSDFLGIVSPAYVVQRPREGIYSRYLHYLFRTPGFAKEAERWSYGITSDMWSLRPAHFKMIYSSVPHINEQVDIVRFLDHVDGRIGRYIRAKQKLIKLLEEQKQAIINRAVTRGLDLSVRLRPSCVEWLGDVPEHWEVMPIKRAFTTMVYGISESSTEAGTVRLLTMGHIQNGKIKVPTEGGVSSVGASLLVEKNDLLFNRTNSAELVGKVGLFDGACDPVTFASYLVRMRPRSDMCPGFLNLLLNDRSVLSAARREAIPSLHQSNLNPTRYGRLQVALPKIAEQEEIVTYLSGATAPLQKAIDSADREIGLLHEYRNRLIADVVTGKLDVREAAARLLKEEHPDDVEEADVEPMTDDNADALDETLESIEA